MRYALLADVHGNLHALEAAVSALESERIDQFLFAGDLVGYNAFPNECIEILEGLGAACVAGNHDLIALDRLSDERCIPLARQSLSWTRDVLVEDSIRFLSALPLMKEAPGGVALAHGSLSDPQEYTNRPEQAARQLDQIAIDAPGVKFLVLGHTHHPWCYGRASGTMKPARDAPMTLPLGQRYLINPGSVGQSREFKNHARFAVLDLGERTVAFRSIVYDFSGCRRALWRNGLPQRSCHLPPSFLRRGKRLLRSAAGRLLAARSRSAP